MEDEGFGLKAQFDVGLFIGLEGIDLPLEIGQILIDGGDGCLVIFSPLMERVVISWRIGAILVISTIIGASFWHSSGVAFFMWI